MCRGGARKIFWGGLKVLSKSCQYGKNLFSKKKITPSQGDIMNLTTQYIFYTLTKRKHTCNANRIKSIFLASLFEIELTL
jgi:hypothetical protein